MKRKLAVLLFTAVFGFVGQLGAQSASGILAPNRMVDWSTAGVQGGIQNRTSICSTLSPGVSASQITSAIAACPSGQVVYLNAGTYNLSSGVVFDRKSNVTLRGAGPDKTLLVFSGSGTGDHPISNIRFGSTFISPSSPPNLTSWNAAAKGSTQITVGSTSNLSVGMMIFLDQLDATSDDGALYVCASGCSSEGGYASRPGRSQVQATRVTAISGTTLTIDPPILMDNWSSSKSPQAWWDPNQVSMDGIEDLSINGQATQSSGVEVNIGTNNAQNCWVKNVKSLYGGNRDSIWFIHGLHNEVVNSYFYGGSTYSTDSAGIEAANETLDLFTNNIFQHMVNAVEDGNDEGLVVAYNYMYDEYAAPSSWLPPAFFLHSGGVLMELYEGNTANMIQGDRVHGSHALVTVFRNRLFGRSMADSSRTENGTPVELQSYTRYFNIIGNVLGNPSTQKYYQDTESSNNNNPNTSDYVLGFTGQVGASGSSDDPLVLSTLLRWGNYDVVTGAVRWDTSEIPSSLSQYANSVPSQILPASFFLSSQPGWWSTPWGTPPWPAIGPDVTGGNGPGGHSYDIPAKLCYTNTSKDSSGILNFNANSCYTSSPAPAAPSGLGAVAH